MRVILRRHQRRFIVALGVSICAHVALFMLPKIKPPDIVMAGGAQEQPLTVRLMDVQPAPQSAPAQPAEPQPTPSPPPRPVPIPAPIPTPLVARKSPQAVPAQPTPPAPPPPPRPPPIPELDMAAMIEARRSQRQAFRDAQQAQASGQRPTPTPDQLAQANIARNLRMDEGRGVGGVFEILRKSTRTAEFAFNGWRPDTEKRWREVIEVDAGQGGDIELAIVKRMIELIRTHYTGDFRWDSHYLGRVVVLSARPADQVELEAFLMREFFGTPTTKPAYQ